MPLRSTHDCEGSHAGLHASTHAPATHVKPDLQDGVHEAAPGGVASSPQPARRATATINLASTERFITPRDYHTLEPARIGRAPRAMCAAVRERTTRTSAAHSWHAA